MKLLITGIVFFVLPIITWFSSGFVEAAGTTIFFWAIGISMILVGADRRKTGGIWAVKKKPSSKPPKGHDARVYKFDDDGKITGYKDVWIVD
ncbi:MAG: hypothetical protein AAB721_02050 [Patescibacteria group bacterium]